MQHRDHEVSEQSKGNQPDNEILHNFLLQPFAKPNVQRAHGEEGYESPDEDQIVHANKLPPKNKSE
jgi:hypothetical protein